MCYGFETHRKSKTDRWIEIKEMYRKRQKKKICIDRQTNSYTESPIMNKTRQIDRPRLNPLRSNNTHFLISWLYFSSSHTLTCLQASDLCERAGGPGKIRIWLIPQHYCAATGNNGTSALLHWLRTTVDNWLIYHREWGRAQRMMGVGCWWGGGWGGAGNERVW